VTAVILAECFRLLFERWMSIFSNPEEKLEKIVVSIPLENRMTTPEEIGDTVVLLLSDRS